MHCHAAGSRLLLAALLFLTAACDTPQNGALNRDDSVAVEVERVAIGALARTLTYSGDIEADVAVEVFSKVADRISRLHVDAGDTVRSGALLATIHAASLEQALLQAEAARDAARAEAANLEAEATRARTLYTDRALSRQQLDAILTRHTAALARLEQAEAAVATARNYLADARITAPIAGVVGRRYCEAGDMAGPAQPLFRIVQMTQVRIRFAVTEIDLGRIALGQTAAVNVRSYPDHGFAGRVSRISPVLDPLTRMADVEVRIDNREGRLKPGMYARVAVTTDRYDDMVLVPRHAVIESTTLQGSNNGEDVVRQYFVFVADSGMARQRRLTVGYANDTQLAVTGGIAPGERLITLGQHFLRDGAAIHIVSSGEQGHESDPDRN